MPRIDVPPHDGRCLVLDRDLHRCVRIEHEDGPCVFRKRMTRAERLAFDRAAWLARVDMLRRTAVAAW